MRMERVWERRESMMKFWCTRQESDREQAPRAFPLCVGVIDFAADFLWHHHWSPCSCTSSRCLVQLGWKASDRSVPSGVEGGLAAVRLCVDSHVAGSPKYVGARGRLYVKRMDNIANTSRVLSRIAAVVGYSLLAVWLTQHARLTRAIFNMQKHGQVQPLTAALAEIGFLPKTDSDIQLFFLIVSLADEKKVRLLQHWLGRKDPRVQLYGRLHAAAARINKLHLISVFALSSMAALKSFSRDRRRAAQAERNWLSRRRQRATGGRSTEEEEEAAGEGGSPAPDDDEQIEVDLPVDSN